MNIEEIYTLVSQRLLQGAMMHQQLANYYDFLGLEGYKYCHEYHLDEEFCNYRKFISYYTSQNGKLIPKQPIESLNFPSVIPDNWYNFTKQDVDINTKRNAVKSGVEKWLHWEKQTKKFLEDMVVEFTNLNEIGASLKLKEYILDVQKQIKKAGTRHIALKSIDYDLPTIFSEQECLKKKYKKKLHKRKESKDDKSA